MSSQSKKTVQEASRWIRVGVLSVSALLPVLNTVINRIRAQQEVGLARVNQQNAKYKEKLVAFTTDTQSDVHDRLQSVGTTLSDVLTELRVRSNNQDLIRRTSDLREDLRDRGSKLSHVIAERGGEVSGQLVKRGRQAQQTIAEQDRRFWIAMGFGLGLTVTGIVTFSLVRRRLQHTIEVEEPPIQLTYDTMAASPETDAPVSDAATSASDLHGQIYAVHPSNGHVEALSNGATGSSSSASTSAVNNSAPADAVFVGVASTKYYYPVETPLVLLTDVSEKPVDLIYFTSEQDALAQGFRAAEV